MRRNVPVVEEGQGIYPTLTLCRLPMSDVGEAARVSRPMAQICHLGDTKRSIEAGQYRKGIQALTSEGLAPASAEILEEMLSKLPKSPPPLPLSTPPSPPTFIIETDVFKALCSFPGDSAPGPSLLRANHLRKAIHCPTPDCGNKAFRAISGTVNLLYVGRAPSGVVPHLCGATLLASCKKGGGYRPITVGEVLRRLNSKCLSRAALPDTLRSLTPLQVGVGVKAGCEAIVHSVAHTLDDPNPHPDSRGILQLDFSNAFNSISCSCMFEEFRARIPSLSAWKESCYGSQPVLHFWEHTILSQCGVQQGDPLGPLGFALTLQPIVERIKREVPNLHIKVWYLDYGTLCGSPEDLLRALEIVEEDGPPRGLFRNRSKLSFSFLRMLTRPIIPSPLKFPSQDQASVSWVLL